MAIAPLFISSVVDVKKRLRLSGVVDSSNAQSMIEEALRTVRVGFYRRISNERISEIASAAVTENPTNDAEIIRQLAEVTELKWIRLELLRTMPTLFADSTPLTQEAWNTEALLRGSSVSERDMEIRRLEADIEQAMSVLVELEQLSEETTVKTSVYIPTIPPPPLGSTVFPRFAV